MPKIIYSVKRKGELDSFIHDAIMKCFLFRFSFNGVTLASGITYSLNKVYRKNHPITGNENSLISKKCQELNIDYNQIKMDYAECESDNKTKETLEKINSGKTPELKWSAFVSKTAKIDNRQYKKILINKLNMLREINAQNADLHEFLIDNFNSIEECIYFNRKYNLPDDWQLLSVQNQKKYIQSMSGMDKKFELAPDYFIKVFSGYDSRIEGNYLIIRNKINVDKIPFLVVSMYNSIIFTAHRLNLLLTYMNEEKYPVPMCEMPFYLPTKPLRMYYTKEMYISDFVDKSKMFKKSMKT